MKRRIIIVTNQAFWRKEIVQVCETEGHKIVAVLQNDENSYKNIEHLNPDLLLIDTGRLGFKGIHLANQLTTMAIPFVYLIDDKDNEEAHICAYNISNAKPFKIIFKQDYEHNPSRVIRDLNRELDMAYPLFTINKQVLSYTDVLWIHGVGKMSTIYCKKDKQYKYKGQLKDFFIPINASNYLYSANRNTLINIHNVKSWRRVADRRYSFFFDEDKSKPLKGIVASGRKSKLLVAEIKKNRTQLRK